MKRFNPAAFIAAILLLALLAACATTDEKKDDEQETIRNYVASGKIVNLKGKVIEVALFLDLELYLTFVYQGSRHSTPIINVKSLVDIGNGYLTLTTVDGRSFKIVATMGSISRKDVIYFQTKSLLDSMPLETNQQADPNKKIKYFASRIDGEATKQIEFVWKKKTDKQNKDN